MQKDYLRITILVLTVFPLMTTAAEDACYPAGGVAGIVIATVVVTAVVIGLSLAAAWKFWRRKKVRNKRPENNHKGGGEKIPGDFAFDNPYFRDQEDDETDTVKQGKARSSINKSPLRSSKQSDLSTKGKKGRSGKGHFIFGGGQGKRQRAMDDSCLAVEPERTVVALRGHDFTGLGFNICGNMRDGILVKDVLHRGPASESGKIKAGDRIINVTVSFTNIVYEDALTILSYASPYDVQLELERMAASEKARSAIAVGESPSGSKRLGSCSFSSSGPKLFHPLYRSQSIDDLTQIDRDTFPSHHGFGPRRSQSVGVAAHKLASHFKNSDSRLAEEDKKKKDGRNPGSASVILSTTGSLNEKMLANVMADGALNKQGGLLHWEKRFEDTLENDDSTCAEPVAKKKTVTSSSSSNDDSMDEVITTSGYRSKFRRSKGNSKRNSKHKNEDVRQQNYGKHGNGPQSNTDLKTSVQVHHSEDLKEIRSGESSSEVWHLNQSIKTNKNSDLDTSDTYPWNSKSQSKLNMSDKSPSVAPKENNEKSNTKNTTRNYEEDSDVSGDSLEDGKKHRSRHLMKNRTSSIDDVTQPEDTVGNHVNHGHYSKNVLNFGNERTSSNGSYQNRNVKKVSNESIQDNLPPRQQIPAEKTQSLSHAQYANSSVAQLCSKEKRLERAVMNTAHSPRLSVKSPKPKCDSNDNFYSKPISYSNATHTQMEESPNVPPKLSDKSGYHERQNQNCPRIQGYQVSNNLNSPKGEVEGNRTRMSTQQNKQQQQQRTQPSNYQKQPQPRQIPDEQEVKMSDTRNGPPVAGYTQVLRKTVNPAGMFTQINPFQQASRSKNNINSPLSKSWTSKEQLPNSLPVNGNNDFRYHPQYTKNVPITSTDSSGGRSRTRMNLNASDTQTHSQKVLDGNSKTVLISTYDLSNNTSSNFRQMRN